MENLLTVVFSRQRSSTPEGQAIEKAILKGLDRWPQLPVLVIPHLYDLLPNGMGFEALRGITTNMVVLSWLYPRAAFWVLQANGVRGQMGWTPLVPEEELEPAPSLPRQNKPSGSVEPAGVSAPGSAAIAVDQGQPSQTAEPGQSKQADTLRTIWCLDLRNPGAVEDYIAEMARLVELTEAAAVSVPEPLGPPTRLEPYTMQEIDELLQPRWYPVIDRVRCQNCQECLNFCLFGVYGLDAEGRVWVEMPDACRPGCPACARVCPSGAIMFPDYSDPAIAGGPWKPQAPSPSEAPGSQAASSHSPSSSTSQTPSQGNQSLDRLVDELDQMEP